MNDNTGPDGVGNNDVTGNKEEPEVESLPQNNAADGNVSVPSTEGIIHQFENDSNCISHDTSIPSKKHPKRTDDIYSREYSRMMRLYKREIKDTLDIFNSIEARQLATMKQMQCIPDLSQWSGINESLLHNNLPRIDDWFNNLRAPNIIIPMPQPDYFDVIDKFINDIDIRQTNAYGGILDKVHNINNSLISLIPESFNAMDQLNINDITNNILPIIQNDDDMFMRHDPALSSYINNTHYEIIDQIVLSIGNMRQVPDVFSAFPEIKEALRMRAPQWSDLFLYNTRRHGQGSCNDPNPPRCEIEELLEYAKRRGWSARRLSKALNQWIGNNHSRQQSIDSNSSSITKTCGQRAECRSASRDVLITDLGGTYRIRLDGDEYIINKSKGLAMIKFLTDHPDKFFSCLELQFYASKGSIDRKLVGENDETARRYGLSEGYQRYQERREEILEAVESNAWDQKSELEIKHEAEVSKLLGGQRGRSVSSERTRSRIAVKNAITHALKKIEPTMPKLESHLHERVQTGHYCRYLKLSKYN